MEKKIKKELYPNQKDASKEIISHLTNKKEKCRYVILNAPTQSGKTGCIMSLINDIDESNSLRKKLGVETIYYITGDNQGIKQQTIDDFRDYCTQYIFNESNVFFFKNSDLGKIKSPKFKNCLIFLDESHYGTSKEKNRVPKFLKDGGINYMKNDTSMEKNNIYISSVSATPYPEILNDYEKTKKIVTFSVGESYRGIKEFYNNNQLKIIDDSSILKYEILLRNLLVDEVLPHLDDIEKKRKKKKFVIMRGNNKINYKELLGDKYKVFYMDSKKDTLTEEQMYLKIQDYCIDKTEDADKYLLFVIKGKFRMGKRFRDKCKDYCGCVIDFSEGENISTTEQGLLGRFCGYVGNDKRTKTDWKDIWFYVSEKHTQPLIDYYLDDKLPTPYHSKNSYTKSDTVVWGRGDKVKPNTELLKSNGVKSYDVTKYIDDDIKERLINYEVEFKPSELKKIVSDIVTKCPKIDNKYLNYLDGGHRRLPNSKGDFKGITQIDGGKHRPFLTDIKNYGKGVWKPTLITYSEDKIIDKIILEIQETIIDKYEKITNQLGKLKEIHTYSTKSNDSIPLPSLHDKRFQTV